MVTSESQDAVCVSDTGKLGASLVDGIESEGHGLADRADILDA